MEFVQTYLSCSGTRHVLVLCARAVSFLAARNKVCKTE